MRIARFSIDGNVAFGAVEGEKQDELVLDIIKGIPFADFELSGTKVPVSKVRLLPPVLPNKVVAFGRNYADHAEEMGNEVPDAPFAFFKPATSVIGPGDEIQYPSFSQDVHHEAELAVVIGRLCREVPRERVKDVIFGYTCANDVTARDVQKREKQWARAKGFDTSCPLGPWVETDLDPHDLTIQLTVNGGQRQLGRTSEMIHSIEDLIVNISEAMTLLPGDVILTGTPAGVGPSTSATRSPSPSKASALSPTRLSSVASASGSSVRVRFCPSPTGNPHVGLVRTALFNWAFAKHHGGTLVFRIEDTDAARDSEESYNQLLDSMRWLGFDWDEGPEVGGPHAPYRQSQRMDIYRDVARKLLDGGYAYHCYCSQDELDARREAARAAGKPSGYDGHCRELTAAQVEQYQAQGREPIVRFRMPDEPITFTDLVRGEITYQPENVPDYGIVRANGAPLYTLVNPVDDALMEITHVLRGEDLLSSTPRQIALYKALIELGVAKEIPAFGHLPYVMGEGNKKLSKRDPQSSLNLYRERGFLPEGLLNYLSLLGWSLSADQDVFTIDEMVAAFDVSDVNPNPARFDLKKCEAINADHIRMLDVKDFAERCRPWLQPPTRPGPRRPSTRPSGRPSRRTRRPG